MKTYNGADVREEGNLFKFDCPDCGETADDVFDWRLNDHKYWCKGIRGNETKKCKQCVVGYYWEWEDTRPVFEGESNSGTEIHNFCPWCGTKVDEIKPVGVGGEE